MSVLKEGEESLLVSNNASFSRSVVLDGYDGPIEQYNHVIRTYNIAENQVDGIELDEMENSLCYNYFSRVAMKPIYLFLVLLTIIFPFAGTLIYFCIIVGLICYMSRLKVFRANQKRVSNVFKKMVFSPELCRITRTSNKFYEIRIRGILLLLFLQQMFTFFFTRFGWICFQ